MRDEIRKLTEQGAGIIPRVPHLWFDAHLDLAYLAVRGRDMLAPLGALTEHSEGPHHPVGVTLPALKDGGVKMILATIFTESIGADHAEEFTAEQYRAGDSEGAYRRGRAQLEAYLTWADTGTFAVDLREGLRAPEGVGEVRGGMGVAEVVPPPLESLAAKMTRDDRVHAGILMENADPIRDPEELSWWVARGVCAIGLAWARPGRYANGNMTPPEERTGLTTPGRVLVREMDRLGVLHDASHLSDRSLDDLFGETDRVVIASHSNCRALVDRDGHPPNQRHLTDRAIREIARRGGVVGLNLFSPFLIRGGVKERRATLDETLAHVERVCDLTGSTDHVGLGSDMDGGFGSDRLTAGVDRPADYRKLAEGLGKRGWTKEQLEGFAWKNWATVMSRR
ncbi:membrane dipeptidase [Phycisphaerales bacterium]|nr:membrane dipeptidase [Phycisphaerales bacterium]